MGGEGVELEKGGGYDPPYQLWIASAFIKMTVFFQLSVFFFLTYLLNLVLLFNLVLFLRPYFLTSIKKHFFGFAYLKVVMPSGSRMLQIIYT